jgi:type II secretory pathway component PulC
VTAPTAAVVTAPVTAAPAPSATAAPVTELPALPGSASDPEPTTTMIRRPELRAALADFGKLAASFHGGFVAGGVRVDGTTDGSLFARVGLRPGDIVRAVDNLPLRSLDDAADLYARAGTARNITIQLLRAGKPLTLRVAVQ